MSNTPSISPLAYEVLLLMKEEGAKKLRKFLTSLQKRLSCRWKNPAVDDYIWPVCFCCWI